MAFYYYYFLKKEIKKKKIKGRWEGRSVVGGWMDRYRCDLTCISCDINDSGD